MLNKASLKNPQLVNPECLNILLKEAKNNTTNFEMFLFRLEYPLKQQ
jgi:hypothetical protein